MISLAIYFYRKNGKDGIVFTGCSSYIILRIQMPENDNKIGLLMIY